MQVLSLDFVGFLTLASVVVPVTVSAIAAFVEMNASERVAPTSARPGAAAQPSQKLRVINGGMHPAKLAA